MKLPLKSCFDIVILCGFTKLFDPAKSADPIIILSLQANNCSIILPEDTLVASGFSVEDPIYGNLIALSHK